MHCSINGKVFYRITVISLSSSVLNANGCYVDCNHQSNIVKSASSEASKQAQFSKDRNEELTNPIISEDKNAFNVLLQLTESYPDLEKCPLLQTTI